MAQATLCDLLLLDLILTGFSLSFRAVVNDSGFCFIGCYYFFRTIRFASMPLLFRAGASIRVAKLVLLFLLL